MLMTSLFTLYVIRFLLCGNSWSWLLNLNLTYKTMSIGTGSGLFISMLEKTQLVLFG